MADGVEYTADDYNIAYNGLINQLEANLLEGVIEHPSHKKDFDSFIHNTAEVIAYERAYNRMLRNALHEQLTGDFK